MKLIRLWMADWLAWVGLKPLGKIELPSSQMLRSSPGIVALIFVEPLRKNLSRPFPDIIPISKQDFHWSFFFCCETGTEVQEKLPTYSCATASLIIFDR